MIDSNKTKTYIGNQHAYGGGRRLFGIHQDDKARHMYLVGKTGTGKSTLLRNMIIQDVLAGRGLCFIDPLGYQAEEILDFIPKGRTQDVIYFNPTDQEHPIAFNVLENVPPDKRHLVVSGVVSVFKHIWRDAWGARTNQILSRTLATVLEHGNGTLLSVLRLLTDDDYRKRVTPTIQDPVLRNYWLNQFARYDKRFMVEATAPVLNKVEEFLSSPLIRNILCRVKSTIDLRSVMDNQQILIINLSGRHLGEDMANLVGSLLATKLQLTAMERPHSQATKPFSLYIDEFHNLTTDSFASILSQARNYKLNLTVANQYISQMKDTIRDAVFGNVGSIISFRVGADDAEHLEKEYGRFAREGDHPFSASQFTDLRNHEVLVKTLIDGEPTVPFRATTLPPLGRCYGRRDRIIRKTRNQHARKKRAVVEDKINRWMGRTYTQEPEYAPVGFK